MSEPPPYALEEQSTTAPSRSSFQDPEYLFNGIRPTNYLDIHQVMTAISGTWRIDTSLQIPGYDRSHVKAISRSLTVPRANLSLRTQVGTISATIELIGGPERARLVTTTSLGTINVRVVSFLLLLTNWHIDLNHPNRAIQKPKRWNSSVNPKREPFPFTFQENFVV
jgi:hypothetical protein